MLTRALVCLSACDPPPAPRYYDGPAETIDPPKYELQEPAPLLPSNNHVLMFTVYTFQWAGGSAGPYVIEVSRDSLFTCIDTTIATEDTSAKVTVEAFGVYWWRVRRVGGPWSDPNRFYRPRPTIPAFRSTINMYDLPLQLLSITKRVYAGGETDTWTTVLDMQYDLGYFDIYIGRKGGNRYEQYYRGDNGFERIVSFEGDPLTGAMSPIEMWYRYPTTQGSTRSVTEARVRFTADITYSVGKQTVKYEGDEVYPRVEIVSYRDSSFTREADGGYTTVVKTVAERSCLGNPSLTVYVNGKQ